ncbi:OmpA family protein [Nannocystaceae bacterium ST9]
MPRFTLALVGLLSLLPLHARAGQPEADVDPTRIETSPAKPSKKSNWLHRWAPTNNYAEVGIHGGILLLDDRHELFSPRQDRLVQGWMPLRQATPEIGVRVGYYPLRFVGVEAEGALLPTRARDVDGSALIYTVRGHVIGQLGLWALTPFVLVGGGLIGIRSSPDLLGRDVDPALDFGGGLKLHLDRWVLRLDVRDLVTNRQGVAATFQSHNLEVLLGVSVMLGRKRRAEPSHEPEPVPPWEPEPGPDLIGDSDGDGFYDDRDACVDEPGVGPDGCPPPDRDGDGILDDVDVCADQPETRNGFEDADGCPDEVPEAVAKFNGKITGITFETGKATIQRSSLPVLDEAVRVLLEHPSVRIEIAGHTDDTGEPARNLELSKQRADSVASYLEGMGVAADRMITVGLGQDVPIDSNATRAGRANNRRIEFKILTE